MPGSYNFNIIGYNQNTGKHMIVLRAKWYLNLALPLTGINLGYGGTTVLILEKLEKSASGQSPAGSFRG